MGNDAKNSDARQNAEGQFASLQQSIKDRHEGVEQDMQKTINPKNTKDKQLFKEMEENDDDWRDAVFNTASHVTGLNEPEPEPEPEKEEPVYEEAKVEQPKKEELRI